MNPGVTFPVKLSMLPFMNLAGEEMLGFLLRFVKSIFSEIRKPASNL